MIRLIGGIVIRNYAPTIFEDAGLSNRTALLLNVFLGIVKLIVVIVSISYVRKQFV